MNEKFQRRTVVKAAFASTVAGALSACAGNPERPQQRPLAMGQIALSFHVASAAIVRQILQRDHVTYSLQEAPHEKIYERLGTGEIDMAVSAWLPGSHGAFIKPYENELLKLGILYEPYTIWGVPDYVPESDLAAVEDLLKPEVSAKMIKVVQGIGPGAGISRFSREIFAQYGLEAAGYEFRNGSLDDCVAAFERAVAHKRWVVVPLWHPQFLHNVYKIRALREPRGLLRGRDQATLVLRKNAAGLLPERTIRTLRGVSLGNAAVAELDFMISREKLEPMEAARRWMERNPGVVSAWG